MAFIVVPLGLSTYVHRKLTTVRPLDDDGLRCGVYAYYSGIKLIDVSARVAGPDRVHSKDRRYLAGDLPIRVDLDLIYVDSRRRRIHSVR